MHKQYSGRWEIDSMGMCSKDFIDLIEPGYFLINADDTGEFVFGAVSANIDGCFCTKTKRFEYSWEGSDENDPVCGRGWFQFDSLKKATGQIYVHMGDESSISLAR